jgi:hypothetical protein
MLRLTIECQPHELRSKLLELLVGPGAIGSDTTEAAPSRIWGLDDAGELYFNVQEGARKMIDALLQAQPEGLTWEEWQEKVGLRGVKFGGARSSIGHNYRAYPGRPEPVIWKNDRYSLESTFARALSTVLDLQAQADALGIDTDDYDTWDEVREEIAKRSP